MRILLINDYYSHRGGAESYFLKLYKLLKENKNEVYVFSMGKQEIRSNDIFVAQETTLRKGLFDSKNFKDIMMWLLRKSTTKLDFFDWPRKNASSSKFQKFVTKYQYIQLFGNYYTDTVIENKLRNLINEIKPSVIHIHNNYKYPASVYSLLKNMDIPIVKTVHDFGMMCPTSWCVMPNGEICDGGLSEKCVEKNCITNRHYILMKPHNKIINKLEKNSVSLFITPSKILKQKMEEYGFNNVVHLPNFINSNNYEFDASKIEIGSILYIGSLTKFKGVHYLIEAFQSVRKEFPSAMLNIVGSGPFRPYLEAKIRQMGVKEMVLFHGNVSDKAVKELYQKANVVVVPSIWMENSPMVIYEAMASGRPVVGSKIGGIPELVRDGKTGYLSEPRNPEDIADKVIKIISDTNLTEKFRKAAREVVINEYSPDVHYRKLIKFYQSLTGNFNV